MIAHRCPEWKDIKLVGGIDWILGSQLEYCDRKVTDTKTGKIIKNFWIMTDQAADAFSRWESPFCPFCGIVLKTLIET